MSVRDDWYRCKDWTPEERERFDAKIRRSRKPWPKWQHFQCQAHLLFWHGRSVDAKQEATRLLERCLLEVKGIEADWAATTLQDLAEFALEAGEADRAIQMFRASIARKPTSERRMRGEHEAEKRLAAVVGLKQRSAEAAVELFAAAHPGRRYPPPYSRFSAAPALDVDGVEAKDPDGYAESIVAYHHGAEDGFDQAALQALFESKPEALAALDGLFSRAAPATTYDRSFLTMYVGQLGAYVGRVLVHHAIGTWEVGEPLMQSRVRIGARLIDPFEIAYRCVFERASLGQAYARALDA